MIIHATLAMDERQHNGHAMRQDVDETVLMRPINTADNQATGDNLFLTCRHAPHSTAVFTAY